MENEAAFDFGFNLGLNLHGVSATQAKVAAAQQETLDVDPNGAEFKRQSAKIAAALYEGSDLAGHEAQYIYEKLASVEEWDAGYDSLLDPVYQALGEWSREVDDAQLAAGIDKTASALTAGPLATLVQRASLSAPSVVKLLLGLSAIGGGAVGATSWYLNRDTEESDAKIEALKARRDVYNRIAQNITDQLANKGNPVDKATEEALAKVLTSPASIVSSTNDSERG
jgi:hypothetical protein